jgi:hypothetical protein
MCGLWMSSSRSWPTLFKSISPKVKTTTTKSSHHLQRRQMLSQSWTKNSLTTSKMSRMRQSNSPSTRRPISTTAPRSSSVTTRPASVLKTTPQSSTSRKYRSKSPVTRSRKAAGGPLIIRCSAWTPNCQERKSCGYRGKIQISTRSEGC